MKKVKLKDVATVTEVGGDDTVLVSTQNGIRRIAVRNIIFNQGYYSAITLSSSSVHLDDILEPTEAICYSANGRPSGSHINGVLRVRVINGSPIIRYIQEYTSLGGTPFIHIRVKLGDDDWSEWVEL